MAEITNVNVFDAEKKFVDFAGLDYFWEKAKGYIDGKDSALQEVVGDDNGGLVKGLKDVQALVGKDSVATQISNAITGLDLANTYDAKGAAATAEQNAKGYADGLNTAMDDRVKVLEAIDHEQLAADASAAAVATVLDGAPERFDTLKEIAQWIADTETADSAADLVTRVKAAEDAIDVINGEAEGSIAKAKADAIASAKTYTDETIAGLDLANTYEAKGTAAELDAALKTSLEGYADQAEADANKYTDLLFESIKFAETTDIDGIFNKVQPEA